MRITKEKARLLIVAALRDSGWSVTLVLVILPAIFLLGMRQHFLLAADFWNHCLTYFGFQVTDDCKVSQNRQIVQQYSKSPAQTRDSAIAS